MENSILIANAEVIHLEIEWLFESIKARMQHYFGHSKEIPDFEKTAPKIAKDSPSLYAQCVIEHQMTIAERLIFCLALAPYIRPNYLDIFFTKNEQTNMHFAQFGGVRGQTHSGFIPSVETAFFLLAGKDLEYRFTLQPLFQLEHFFFKANMLRLGKVGDHEPIGSAALHISDEYLLKCTTGDAFSPKYGVAFPAAKIETRLDWEDLVLHPQTREEVQEITDWIQYQQQIMEEWKLSKMLKKGFRVLFYGPPGTGKTLTACLIGKLNGLDVYRVDLSQIVSKWIGETEKNLARVFDMAEGRGWILFFDEADAIFGKRYASKNSNDRSSNQYISFLLQRIEDYDGIIILATNLKGNMDDAFYRRFQSMIQFPIPESEQRLLLWQNAFKIIPLDDNIDLPAIAQEHELAGGTIINVLRYAALTMARQKGKKVKSHHLKEGIKRELRKAGKRI